MELANQVLERLLSGEEVHDVLQHIRAFVCEVIGEGTASLVIERPGRKLEVVCDPRSPLDPAVITRVLASDSARASKLPGIPFGPPDAPVGVWVDGACRGKEMRGLLDTARRIGHWSLWFVPVQDAQVGHLGWIVTSAKEARPPDARELGSLRFAAHLLCLAARQERAASQWVSSDHDALTGLAGRAAFLERVAVALARRRREGRVAVIVLHFDRLRAITNSLGVFAGNQVLVAVARRLKQVVRRGDVLAQLERDEFAVLLEGLQCEQDAIEVAERLVEVLHRPIPVSNQDVILTASFGIALERDRAIASDLLREAEVALANVRSSGGQRLCVFSEKLDHGLRRRLVLEGELVYALERNELSLRFQPVVDLRSGRIVELEALLRWEHPTYGMISPSEFIPIAEETGAIVSIGRWTLREAARLMRDWLSCYPHLPADLKISVNLSPRQLRHSRLVEDVITTLEEVGLPPSRLKLEITESLLVETEDTVLTQLKRLRELGIELALDDFGTGYSSLGYLSRLPIDSLKIDRTFVGRLDEDQTRAAIVRTIVSFALALGLTVVGEGIETEVQLLHLRALGCNHGQGYYFTRPVDAENVEALLARGVVPLQSCQPLPHEGHERLAGTYPG